MRQTKPEVWKLIEDLPPVLRVDLTILEISSWLAKSITDVSSVVVRGLLAIELTIEIGVGCANTPW